MKAFNAILGFFAIFASFYAMMYPGLTFLSNGWIVTILLGVWGICAVINFFTSRKDGAGQKKEVTALGVMGLILGILAAVLSIMMMSRPGLRLMFDIIIIWTFLGWMIVRGVVDIVRSIAGHKTLPLWGLTLTMGILMLIGGIYGCFHMIVSAMAIGSLMAVLFMLYGFRLITSAFEPENAAKADVEGKE